MLTMCLCQAFVSRTAWAHGPVRGKTCKQSIEMRIIAITDALRQSRESKTLCSIEEGLIDVVCGRFPCPGHCLGLKNGSANRRLDLLSLPPQWRHHGIKEKLNAVVCYHMEQCDGYLPLKILGRASFLK